MIGRFRRDSPCPATEALGPRTARRPAPKGRPASERRATNSPVRSSPQPLRRRSLGERHHLTNERPAREGTGVITSSPVPDGSWTPVPRDTARDRRINRRDLGLLIEVLSYPPGWNVTAEVLADAGSEGRDAVRTALRRLEEAGYILNLRHRDNKGIWRTVSFAGNTPAVARGLADAWLEENPDRVVTDKPRGRTRVTDNQASENQASGSQSSADQPSENQALSTKRQKKKTEGETASETEDQDPPPPTPSTSPATDTGPQGGGGDHEVVEEVETSNPAAVAVIDALPYTRPPNRREHAQLLTLATTFLAAGFTDAELKTHLTADLESMRDRVRVWTTRLAPGYWPKQIGTRTPTVQDAGPVRHPCANRGCDDHQGVAHMRCSATGWMWDDDRNQRGRCPCWEEAERKPHEGWF